MSSRSESISPLEHLPADWQFKCPVCKRQQTADTGAAVCSRCKTDLTQSWRIRLQAFQLYQQGCALLPEQPEGAAAKLQAAWQLHHHPAIAQTWACVFLIRRAWPEACCVRERLLNNDALLIPVLPPARQIPQPVSMDNSLYSRICCGARRHLTASFRWFPIIGKRG